MRSRSPPPDPPPPKAPTGGPLEPAPADADVTEETPPPESDAVPSEPSATALTTIGPPIEVSCFGGPIVRCAGQQVWPRLAGGEVKPWELLLYLACQPAEGVPM